MDREQAKRILRRIGLDAELSPTIESDESLQNLEAALMHELEKAKGKRHPRIKVRTWDRKWQNGKSEVTGSQVTYHGNSEFPRAIEFFCEYYGIGQETKTLKGIGRDSGYSHSVLKPTCTGTALMSASGTDYDPDTLEPLIPEPGVKGRTIREAIAGKAGMNTQIHFVSEYLRQNCRKEIWYGTMLGLTDGPARG